MSKPLNRKSLLRLGALIGTVALSGLAGCGEGIVDPTDSVSSALTVNTAGPYGNSTGTTQSGSHTTPVTRIEGYGSASYVYGIRLYWGTESALYGQTNGATGDVFEVGEDAIYRVQVLVVNNVLRGIKFRTLEDRVFEVGLSPAATTAYDNPDAQFTDLQAWSGSVSGAQTLWGIKVRYVTP